MPIVQKPLQWVIRGLKGTTPDIAYDALLGEKQMNEREIGMVSQKTLELFQFSKFLSSAETIEGQAHEPDDVTTEGIVAGLMYQIFYESLYHDVPIAIQYMIEDVAMVQGGSVVVPDGALQFSPPIPYIDHITGEFYKVLESVLCGERPFEDDRPRGEPRGQGTPVGRVKSTLLRQLYQFRFTLSEVDKEEIPESEAAVLHQKFSQHTHMEYLRYVRLKDRFERQIILLSTLIKLGLKEEEIKQSVIRKARERGCTGYLRPDKNWNIYFIPNKP